MMYEAIEKYLALVQDGKHDHLFADPENALPIITDREKLYEAQEELYRRADKQGLPRCYYQLGVIAEDSYVLVLRDAVLFGGSKLGAYIRMLNRHSAVERSGKDVVILLKVGDRYLIQRHFRHSEPERRYYNETIRGFGEASLSAEENAAKEVYEEAGLSVKKLIRLNNEDAPIAYFVAEADPDQIVVYDREEGISNTRFVTGDEMRGMIASGEISDSYTLTAYTLAKIKGIL